MEVMSTERIGIALVVDQDELLLGIVVDADLRKAILQGRGLDAPLATVMNSRPLTAPADAPRAQLVHLFEVHNKSWIPLVDANGRVAGLALLSEYLRTPPQPNWVVLMAGGLGTRLRPVTDDRPKPMVRLGDRPLLEIIFEQFISSGFRHFYLAVNYLAEQVIDYFGDGSRWGIEIRYLRETRPLGTAGALALIEEPLERPAIVMNGDLLTKVNFRALLDFHLAENYLATLCIRRFEIPIPYGVVATEGYRFRGIQEKPTYRMFTSAGISVLDPSVLPWVPRDTFFDMPTLLEEINRRRPKSVGCFPVEEYWVDIGQPLDYQRAQLDFWKEFLR